MVMRRNQQGSNLFKIDLSAILKTIEDANKDLLINTEILLNELEVLPKIVTNDTELKVVQDFIVKISLHKKDVAQSRLSDGKPFSDASKTIKNWYASIEDQLKSTEKNLSDNVNYYVNKKFEKNMINQKDDIHSEESTVGLTYEGESIISTNNSKVIDTQNESLINDLKINWEIESFDRDLVPIELLRKYFSDYSIKLALSKHLNENGPNKLEGVLYTRVLDKYTKIN